MKAHLNKFVLSAVLKVVIDGEYLRFWRRELYWVGAMPPRSDAGSVSVQDVCVLIYVNMH